MLGQLCRGIDALGENEKKPREMRWMEQDGRIKGRLSQTGRKTIFVTCVNEGMKMRMRCEEGKETKQKEKEKQ